MKGLSIYLLDDNHQPTRRGVPDTSLLDRWRRLMESIEVSLGSFDLERFNRWALRSRCPLLYASDRFPSMVWILSPKAGNRSQRWDIVREWAKVQGIPEHWFRRYAGDRSTVGYQVRLHKMPRFNGADGVFSCDQILPLRTATPWDGTIYLKKLQSEGYIVAPEWLRPRSK